MSSKLNASEFEYQGNNFGKVKDSGIFSPIIKINRMAFVSAYVLASFTRVNHNPTGWCGYNLTKPKELVVQRSSGAVWATPSYENSTLREIYLLRRTKHNPFLAGNTRVRYCYVTQFKYGWNNHSFDSLNSDGQKPTINKATPTMEPASPQPLVDSTNIKGIDTP